ncbi:amidase domain-containing protein [Leifsonia flava]|uniref:Putative amidase domain-containing protein n=1 Tax=Orlajensenia leifsoniae TaxID=2561933 RepID=A0A4Y9QV90_9MICO|nr:amidase domain-containing protein [Leifsonia flava]TFV95113.1 hypothetical protein E4M00_15720 [Leifsonia flava]
MTLFTNQSAIACALAAAITFGGGAAHADTLPDTPTASATPAPTETAPTETPAAAETSAPTEPPPPTESPAATPSPAQTTAPSETPAPIEAPAPSADSDDGEAAADPSEAAIAAAAQRDEATAVIAAAKGNASSATISVLIAAVDSVTVALDGDADDATLTALTAAMGVARTAVEESVNVYTDARAALADQGSLIAADLPTGILDAQKATAAPLAAALAALAADDAVAAAAGQVTAWSANVRGYRPAKATATGYVTQITTLRKTKSYAAATIARAAEVVNSKTALISALSAPVPQTATLNAASARAKAAIAAWRKSNSDRGSAYREALAVKATGAVTSKKYATTVNATYAKRLTSALDKLTAGLNTTTIAQLGTLTQAVRSANTTVTSAASSLATAKTVYANGMNALRVFTKATAATRSPLSKANAALKKAITAKASPVTLKRHITNVSSRAAAAKISHTEAPIRAELKWVAENAWSRSYTWGHPYIFNEDCANFASHALEVRGLGPQVLNISSTSLRNHLVGRGFRETADSQAVRRNVKLGDVIQFDWRNNGRYAGDRDHTGIVTRIDRNANGTITIRYTAHTDPGNDPKVNQTIEASLADWGHDRNGGVFFISI